DAGLQCAGWFAKELPGASVVLGLRLRTPGHGGQVCEQLGASVTNMAAGEIFQALQTGTLDAAEFVAPYNGLALGFYQIAKNYYFPSVIEPGLATELTVNMSKFKSLPDDMQESVHTDAKAEYDYVSSDMFANDPRAMRTLVEKHGVKVHQFPESILEAGAKASAEVISAVRDGDNPLAKKTAESFISALKLLRERSESADSPYIVAREKYFKI